MACLWQNLYNYFNCRLTELKDQYLLLQFIEAISHKYSDKCMFLLDLMLLKTPMLLVGPIQDDFKRFIQEFISTNKIQGNMLDLMCSLMVSIFTMFLGIQYICICYHLLTYSVPFYRTCIFIY